MAEPIALMYFTLDEHRDSGDLRGFNRSEFPELGAERRDAIIAAGIDGDLEMAVIAQERALAEALA